MVFLLDASGSIGNSDFTNMIVTTASAGVALAEIGARVGVVVFNDSATVRVPLQYWENTSQLRANIQGIPYTGGGTNIFIGLNVTASLLGNEGTRVIILLTDGKSPNRDAAEMEAEAAKRAGISIYAAGIGGSISEDELNSLASYPREEYRVYIEDFAEEALNEELQSLIASICLSKLLLYLIHTMGLTTRYTHPAVPP